MAFGRAIILERALATQLQLDVAYATHVTRLNAVEAANVGFDGGRVGMRLAMRSLVDGTRPPQEGLGLGVFSFWRIKSVRLFNPSATLGWLEPRTASVMDKARWYMTLAASISSCPCNTYAKLNKVAPTMG